MRSLACAVLLLSSLLGSEGTVLDPSPSVANSPGTQAQASNPTEPTIALGPVTLLTAPSAPSASPPAEKGDLSAAVPTGPQNAPNRVTPPKEYNAPPSVQFTPPAPTHVVPVAPPQAAAENTAPVLPGTPSLLPSVQAPAPSVARKPNLPIMPPSSLNNPPNIPIGSGNDGPPYPPPQRSFPAIPPSTSGVPREHVKPPIAPPIIAQAPRQQTLAPSSDHNYGNRAPPVNTSPPQEHDHIPSAPPPKEFSSQIGRYHKSPIRGSAPAASPLPQNTNAPAIPKNGSAVSHVQPPSTVAAPKPAPSSRSHGWHGVPKKGEHLPFAPSYPTSHAQGPEVSQAPRQTGAKRQKHHTPPSIFRGHTNFPAHSPSSAPVSSRTPTHSSKRPRDSPTLPPMPPKTGPKAPSAHPIWTLPPPPPNLDCNSLECPEPLADPPAGAPCACVLPIKVGIRLSVDLYSFFPLVSDFADEVSSGVNLAQRQVRVMGANVAGDQPDKTMVLVDLVPMQLKFDNATAFSTFDNLWSKKISLKPSVFGDYEILYVVYPGLPPSPPSAPESVGDGAFGNNINAQAMKPLGVDVGRPKRKVNGSLIAIAVLSTVISLIICTLAAWLLIIRFRGSDGMVQGFPHSALPKFSRSSGTGLLAGRHSSLSGPSGSLGSSIVTYAGQAKTFTFVEIEKATNGFDDTTVLGEGGFGCVYQGTLENGTRVAVKVLKRYDDQEENARCLVYELIPNGSVDSHLHGADCEIAPLDWNARMKIALGAARALAYLHEDSSPCVIHRDFKSSNILLEHDFTPKVSDFGLARTARGEGNQHISTRVMGTFGYVAPEYAMTGHLLVKSDVYSYGVVLLELLTGRKPVDMCRPAGQENLVSWARPLLSNVVSLREAVDPLLGPNVPLDNVAKAAAIASMCVQPEVAHRPSMGEVVQALKLVCSDGGDDGLGSGSFSQELVAQARAVYDVTGMEAERVLLSEMFGSTPVFTPAADADSASFRKQSSSGPLMTGNNKKFWQRLRSMSRGSMSEHGVSPDFETRSECSNR
ncbi:hypothetical protein GUJ93_ZPchr0008g11861 [Zizania palustris]|uniref:Protein kinase domain-containing protein n=1 Tax=Zizania palustris TaxID=103762 RepID=A0A8J5RF92_ZIZPA|nr:hypothetical protein GUJ93_ZPchr0008g11861 [Zizania palustris]